MHIEYLSFELFCLRVSVFDQTALVFFPLISKVKYFWIDKGLYYFLQSFRKYMTFKKDYNELLLHLLCELVKNALHFEEIVSGSTSGLTYIDVKVEDLQFKVNMTGDTNS